MDIDKRKDYMYRDAYKNLAEWKNSKHRKPLVMYGARQVGKTWLIKRFAEEEYESYVYVNLERDTAAANIFEIDLDPKRIIASLQNLKSTKIEPEKTLIIIDEIQAVKSAITALKYFCEEAPEYHLIAAGSLLGVSTHHGTSFPVGKTDSIYLYPMNFCEFLIANGQQGFADAIINHEYDQLEAFHANIMDYLNQYVIIGGMPEVVQKYIDTHSMEEARYLQQNIIRDYERDFSKHMSPTVALRAQEIYRITPAQLAKENKKFIFNMIRSGARAADYEEALLWLEDAGLVKRVFRCNAAKIPISAYEDKDIFKLFLSDIGLLSALADVSIETAFGKNQLFEEFKGAFAEQLVFQEITGREMSPYYYHNDSTNSEVDFLIDRHSKIIPVEVKSGTNLVSRSLNALIKKYGLSYAVKFSTLPYKENPIIENMPLYMAGAVSFKNNAFKSTK